MQCPVTHVNKHTHPCLYFENLEFEICAAVLLHKYIRMLKISDRRLLLAGSAGVGFTPHIITVKAGEVFVSHFWPCC